MAIGKYDVRGTCALAESIQVCLILVEDNVVNTHNYIIKRLHYGHIINGHIGILMSSL